MKGDQVFERNLTQRVRGPVSRFPAPVGPGGEPSGAAPRTRLGLSGGSRFPVTWQEVPRVASPCRLVSPRNTTMGTN